jgi:hypothetical protein
MQSIDRGIEIYYSISRPFIDFRQSPHPFAEEYKHKTKHNKLFSKAEFSTSVFVIVSFLSLVLVTI